VRLLPRFDFLDAILNQTVFSPFLSQLLATSFLLAGLPLAIRTRRLFGGDMKLFSANPAGSFKHFRSPYLPIKR
ncbi:MAG: hypothetical protein WAO07_13945, partial [Desulfobacterales bacterium]